MARKKKAATPTVWIDVSLHSVLIGCSCGWRSDIVESRRAGWAAAHRHYQRAHPGELQYVLDRARYHNA